MASRRTGVPQRLYRQVMRAHGYTCAHCHVVGREHVERTWSMRGGKRRYRNVFSYPTTLRGVTLTIDHIKPVSRGGTSHRDNLRVLCSRCNSWRGAPYYTDRPTEQIDEHW